MIKLPKEVSKIVKELEDKGYHTYCTGSCVRQSLAGQSPLDWDIVTLADFESIENMFDDAEVYNKSKGILRFDYVKMALSEGMETDSADEEREERDINYYIDHAEAAMLDADKQLIIDLHAINSLEEYLGGSDFTVNAMADSAIHGFVDPYQGKIDTTKKLIRTVGDANERFSADPAKMFTAVSLVAEIGYDLAKNTYEAIIANESKLAKVSVGRIREEFLRTLGGENAGKGLRMLVACNMMPYILGPQVNKLSGREVRDMEELTDNLERTLPVAERRAGLFYLCLGKKRALSAIEYMNYEPELNEHLVDAQKYMEELFFITNPVALKDFLCEVGLDRYVYLHNLSKAQVNVYGSPDLRVQSRILMYKDIVASKDPVYIEDLAVTAQELIDAGIVPDDAEKVKAIMRKLTDYMHRNPKENTHKKMMARAQWYKKHPIGGMLQSVNWLR